MDYYVSHFYLRDMKVLPHKLKSIPYLEKLVKFHLDLHSPRYSNSPQVSYLGMNTRRGWNPNGEGLYLLEYRENEAEFWTLCKLGFYILLVKVSSPDTSLISSYSECPKMTIFCLLGFSGMKS